jgi:quinoprotein glucose dehydrogenase
VLTAFAAGAQQGTQGQWRHYGGDAGGTKYAPLDQIDSGNVSDLYEAWRWNSPDNAIVGPSNYAFEGTPLMVDGVLYVSTSFGQVCAIDAGTGTNLWTHDPQSYLNGPPPNNGYLHRGVAYWENGADKRVFIATIDARLIALDAATGNLVNTFGTSGEVDLKSGIPRLGSARYGMTSPPTIVGDVVIVGSSIHDGPGVKEQPPGDVRGFDADTGALIWTFHTIPRSGEFGTATWGNDPGSGTPSWQFSGAANSWAPMTADPDLGYVYVPTGCPTNDYYGGHRPGDNLFSSSLVCLNAATGQRVWHFQFVHHDIWDYDTASPPNLLDIVVDGTPIKAVAQATKTGYIFVFDRETGAPVWPINEVPVPQTPLTGDEVLSPTQPMPTKPPPFELQGVHEADLLEDTIAEPTLHADALAIINMHNYGEIFTPTSVSPGTILSPGIGGGANWGGSPVDPETGILYNNSIGTVAFVVELFNSPQVGNFDYYFFWYILNGPPGHYTPFKAPFNTITAYDLNDGTIAWRVPNTTGDGLVGIPGSVLTKTLLFYHVKSDTEIRAFNKATGSIVWEHDLGTNTTGVPMTYMHEGKQYIVIAVGDQGQTMELVALRLPDSAFANVPDVVGDDESSAIATINAVTGLSVGVITYVYSSTVPAGEVIDQSITDPVALLGTQIDLTVSLGPSPVPATTPWSTILLSLALVLGGGAALSGRMYVRNLIRRKRLG